MTLRPLVPALLAAVLSSCASAPRPPRPAPAAAAPPAPSAARVLAEPLPPLKPLEPLLCALYAGDAPPDVAAKEVSCVVEWLRAAELYLADGGAPTRHTNAKQLAWWRKKALALNAKVAASLSKAGGPAAAPKPGGAAPRADAAKAARDAQQRYLSGIIYFQKGDYLKAREEWLAAQALNPDDPDPPAGLERLAKLGVR